MYMGCDDEPDRCEQDSDCREGYRCDLKIYVGECIQQQDVITCGSTLCFYPQERCVQERCVEASEVSDMEPPLAGLSGGSGGGGSSGGLVAGSGEAGEAGAQGASEAGEAGAQGASEPPPELRVEWETPAEGSLVALSDAYTVSGVVRYGGELVTASQGVSVSIRWLSALEGPSQGEPIHAQVGDQGRFEAEVSLPAGVVTLIGEVNAFGLSAQGLRQVTLDEFVTAQGAQLIWAGQPYRALGVDLPQLLPWLEARTATERVEALEELWSLLRRQGVKYVRTFVGWTRGPGATLTGAQSFDPEGVARLDQLIESATKGGVKLILVLADPSRELVGYEDYLRWSGVMSPQEEDEPQVYRVGQARALLLGAMSLFPARQNSLTGRFYRDEPAILGWELLNRPSWGELTSSDRQQVSGFLVEATELIGSAAPHQLQWTGELGFDSNPTPYGEHATQLEGLSAGGLLSGLFGGRWADHLRELSANVAGLALDMRRSFIVSPTQWPAFGSAWLRGHALASFATQRPKPLSVSYAQLTRTGVDPETQRAVMSAWSAEAFSQGYSLFTVSECTLPGEERSGDEQWALEEEASEALFEELRAHWSRD
jgi:hypothetical protein